MKENPERRMVPRTQDSVSTILAHVQEEGVVMFYIDEIGESRTARPQPGIHRKLKNLLTSGASSQSALLGAKVRRYED